MATQSLEQALKEVNKAFKDTIVHAGYISRNEYSQSIPFTSSRINYMTYGGIPRGRLVEFFGEENGGKTTTALDIVGNAQKLFNDEYDKEIQTVIDSGGKPEKVNRKQVLFVDCEHTFDHEWAVRLGVDVENLIMFDPDHQYAEEILDAVLKLIVTGEIGLVVIDSLAAMMSKQEFEKDIEEKTYAGISGALTVFSRKASDACRANNCTLIGINQLRDDFNNPYNKRKTPGGKAWKFFCTLRMEFRKGDYIDAMGNELKKGYGEPSGNRVEVSIEKTKSFKPNRKHGFYSLNYTCGIDETIDLVATAIKLGIIEKSASWFKIVDLDSGEYIEDDNGVINIQGEVKMVCLLNENEDIRNVVCKQVKQELCKE